MPEEPDSPVGPVPPVADPRLADVFEDLEQQAAALHLGERDAELADRAHGEYAEVTLGARLHASSGQWVGLGLPGVQVAGRLEQVGLGWCLVSVETLSGGGRSPGAWLVRTAALLTVSGLSARAVPEVALPAIARLGLRAAVRRLAEVGDPLVVRLVDGTDRRVRIRRVGADFLEGESVDPGGSARESLVLPFGGVAALHA